MSSDIKFGTDGWRGVIADDFTFANVQRVAQALADYLVETHGTARGVIVGYDNRFLSEVFAKRASEVLAANGLKVLYPPQSAPTPAVSFAVKDRGLCGGAMITASHNPPEFNGFKLKAHYGGSADPEICAQVEARVDRSPVRSVTFDDAVREKKIEIYDPRPAHVKAIKRHVDFRLIANSRLKVVADAMHGTAGSIFADTFARAQCRVSPFRAERDPLFGGMHPEPIGTYLAPLGAEVRRLRADVGFATDGDADRIGVVDERGRYVTIQVVFAMLLLHLLRNRKQRGFVVKSSNSTVWVDRICKAYGLEWREVPVGFKYICEVMREKEREPLERQVLIGGEESGGVGFRGHVPERDGLLAGLMLLELLAMEKRSVTKIARGIAKEFGPLVYDRVDIHYPVEQRLLLLEKLKREPPARLLRQPVREVKSFDGVKFIAANDSWLMLRASGTEPILRIYAEGKSAAEVRRLLELGQKLAQTAL
jgi:phosphomannomutase